MDYKYKNYITLNIHKVININNACLTHVYDIMVFMHIAQF